MRQPKLPLWIWRSHPGITRFVRESISEAASVTNFEGGLHSNAQWKAAAWAAALQNLADTPMCRVRSTIRAFMKILALDFSTLRRSAAVVDDNGNVISSVMQQAQRAGSPFPLISEALGKIRPDEIEAIAIGLGPGSYTGIRSSLAIAQGWNLARNIPAGGVSSAEAIAFAAVEKGLRGEVEVVIDAQRNELYSAIYLLTSETFSLIRPLKIVGQPETKTLIGPEANRWSAEAIIIEPSAAAIGKLAARAKKFGPPENLEAIYLREPSFVKAPAIRHA